MQIKTEGLIITEKCVGESDRLVTVLTRDEGVLRAFAQRAKKSGSSLVSATQLFCYSRLTVFKGRDKYIIDDAQPIDVFFNLRQDIERLALAQYFCELAGALAPQEAPAGDFLRLMLNAMHFLGSGKRPALQLKAVVEMRMLSLAGYMPDLLYCAGCGCYEAPEMYFLPREGALRCADCFKKGGGAGVPLDSGALTALRHTVYADFEKLFAFTLPQEGLAQLAKASEQYALTTLERSFQTLEFYRGLQG